MNKVWLDIKGFEHNHDCTHKTAGGYHWEYLPTLE